MRTNAKVMNYHAAVDPRFLGKRRQMVRVETTEETGARSNILPPSRRLMAVALGRTLARNFSLFRGFLWQLRLNVAGWDANLSIRAKGAEDAQNWFNNHYVRNCDFREDLTLAHIFGLIVESVYRDGDIGIFIDRHLKKTGKIILYESDQILDPPSSLLKRKGYESFDGVIRDGYGRVVGYGVSGKRGGTATEKDVSIIWRDPDNPTECDFRLVSLPFRANQGRGISPLLCCIHDLFDCLEMRSKEIQTAKTAATLAGYIKRSTPADALLDPRLSPNYQAENEGGTSGTETTTGSPGGKEYDRLGAFLGGIMEYLDIGDEFVLLDPKRPNVHMPEFIAHVVESAGAGIGIARSYATLKAESSYTAFRGEMAMTWVLFRYLQRWFEDTVQDWVAQKAIEWAIANKLCKEPESGWQAQLYWRHPQMPGVDEAREQAAITAKFRNGLLRVEDLFGYNWEKEIDELARALEIIRAKFPEFAGLELKSGGIVPTEPKEEEKEPKPEEKGDEESNENH